MAQLRGTRPAVLAGTPLLSLPLTAAIQCIVDTSIKIIAPKHTILYFDDSGPADIC